jgi:hypothetical protein
MVRVLAILLIFASSLFGSDLSLRGARGVTNVWLGDAQLTHFKNPHHIYDMSISPSRKYALVSHMDFRPTKIMTIDLATRKVLADFAPGFAGENSWTAEDQIAIVAGCGAGCSMAAIFDVSGKETLSADDAFRAHDEFRESAKIEMHPTRRALVFMPNSISCCPGSIVLLKTSDNRIARIGPTNLFCVDWKVRGDALEVSVRTNRNDFEPTGKMMVRLPKEWEDSSDFRKR